MKPKNSQVKSKRLTSQVQDEAQMTSKYRLNQNSSKSPNRGSRWLPSQVTT